MTLQRISRILGTAGLPGAVLPPTLLFNEGWMLRIVLDWFSSQPNLKHDLAFAKGAVWYTEGLLPSRFLPRFRGDRLAESYTHADGVIGHISIGRSGDGDVSLADRAKQLIVVEAKMFSRLARGVTHAPEYNQAARNVACMAEVLRLKGIKPDQLDSLGFYVIAPQAQLADEPTFKTYLDKDHMRSAVAARASQYSNEDKGIGDWHRDWFLPLLDRVAIKSLSWEEVLSIVEAADKSAGSEFRSFYEKCLEFNSKVRDVQNG